MLTFHLSMKILSTALAAASLLLTLGAPVWGAFGHSDSDCCESDLQPQPAMSHCGNAEWSDLSTCCTVDRAPLAAQGSRVRLESRLETHFHLVAAQVTTAAESHSECSAVSSNSGDPPHVPIFVLKSALLI